MVLPSIYKRDASVDRTKTFKTDQIQLLRSSGIEPKNTTEAHRASSLPARNAAHATAAGVTGGSARVVRARKPKMQSERQKGRLRFRFNTLFGKTRFSFVAELACTTSSALPRLP